MNLLNFSGSFLPGSRSTPLYDLLNIRYVIARKDAPFDWDKFALAFDGDPDLNVYRNRNVLPRAQIIHDAQVVDDGDEAWQAVQAPSFDPATQVVIESQGAQTPTTSAATGPEQAQWLQRSGNELALEVTTTAPGYLVLSEVWYPGWQAEVEVGGQIQRQPVLRANAAFQAIPLWEAGAHRVRVRFAPATWRVGVVLAVATFVALVVLGVWLARRSRRRPRNG